MRPLEVWGMLLKEKTRSSIVKGRQISPGNHFVLIPHFDSYLNYALILLVSCLNFALFSYLV
jgi:hypothetical protein